MDHAEARARVSDLALEPARLRRFDRAGDPGEVELREHLAGCADCRAELDAWRSNIVALDTAVGTTPADGVQPAGSLRELAATGSSLTLPPSLRARTPALEQERTRGARPKATWSSWRACSRVRWPARRTGAT